MGYVRKMTVDPVDISKVADGAYPGSFTRGRFRYSVEVVESHLLIRDRSSQTCYSPTST